MVQILILRELKARYRGTALGFLWSFLNPLVLMVVYVLVFSVYFRVDMEHYPVFVLSAILPWTSFSSGLTEAANSIISNGGLIKKVYLPSEIFPLVYVGSNMAHYLLSIPILLLFLLFFGRTVSWPLLFFPWILTIQLLFTYGLALVVSSLAVQFRDLVHVVSNLLMIWFFVTPIFYPVTMVPEKYRVLVNVNPMAQLIMAYQDIFFSNRIPSIVSLMILTGVSVAFLAVGLTVFRACRDVFAEVV